MGESDVGGGEGVEGGVMSCAISMGLGDMERIISRDSARRVGVVGVIGVEVVASNSSVRAIWLSGGSCALISLLEEAVSMWSITASRIQVPRLRIHAETCTFHDIKWRLVDTTNLLSI